MTITAELIVGKMAMHTEKADETLLHHAHVAILNHKNGKEGQLLNSECNHLNTLKAKQKHLLAAFSRLLNHADGLHHLSSSFLGNKQGTMGQVESTGNNMLKQKDQITGVGNIL